MPPLAARGRCACCADEASAKLLPLPVEKALREAAILGDWRDLLGL